MGDGLHELHAIREILETKARSCRLMDTKDWDGMRTVFTDDVVMDSSDSGGSVVTGGDAFMGFLRAALDGVITVHHVHSPEIVITAPTEATGVWAMEDLLRWPSGREMHGYGHYHETYRLVDGRWRIASSRLTRLRMDLTDV